MVKVSTPVKWVLRILAIGYVFFLVAWPVSLVIRQTFAHGLDNLIDALSEPQVSNALLLSLQVAFWAVLINTVFGVGISILLVRYEFPGKRVLSALIDLPLSVSPIVVGLALLLVYNGRDGWFGPAIEESTGRADHLRHARHDHGDVLRGAAAGHPRGRAGALRDRRRPGAGRAQPGRRRHVDVPADHPAQHQVGVVYGVVLSLARSLGEFGAVKIVSGNITGRTQTATLVVEAKYQNFQQETAYATSFLLIFVSIACLIVVAFLRPKHTP